jgi:spermidine/putrescine transport system permease protein
MFEAGRAHGSAARQLAPALVFLAICFGIPLLMLFGLSFFTQQGFERVPDLNVGNYVEGVTSRLYQTVLVRTLLVGLLTAAVVVPVAYVLAYLMRFTFDRRGQILLDVILISLFSGYLVRIYAWRTILGREGILNGALMELGLIQEPITFLIYSNWSVMITLVGLLLPLALLPIYSSMSNVSRDHLEVARDLGSRGLHLHRTILLPMVLPGVGTAFAIAFVLAAGDFVVPAMVGGTQAGVMVGNLIADQFKGTGANWPLGAAMAFLIMGLLILVYAITTRLLRAVTRW